jgi:hypothetical protein
MRFLLRCLFWLGLVFSQIAEHEGANLAVLSQPAAMAAGAADIRRRAIDAAATACRDNAAACLAAASRLVQAQTAQIGEAARIGEPSPQAAQKIMGSQKIQAPQRIIGSGGEPRRDTLRDADRVPAWRLRPSKDGA